MWAAEFGHIPTLENAVCYNENKDAVLNPGRYIDEREYELYDFTVDFDADPLHIAAKFGHNEVVTWLLDRGANIAAVSSNLCDCYYFDHVWEDEDGKSQRRSARSLVDSNVHKEAPSWLPLPTWLFATKTPAQRRYFYPAVRRFMSYVPRPNCLLFFLGDLSSHDAAGFPEAGTPLCSGCLEG